MPIHRVKLRLENGGRPDESHPSACSVTPESNPLYGAALRYNPTNTAFPRTCPATNPITALLVATGDIPVAGTFTIASSAYSSNT